MAFVEHLLYLVARFVLGAPTLIVFLGVLVLVLVTVSRAWAGGGDGVGPRKPRGACPNCNAIGSGYERKNPSSKCGHCGYRRQDHMHRERFWGR